MGTSIIPYEPYHPHLGYTIALTVLTWALVILYSRYALRDRPRLRVVLYGIAIVLPLYAEGGSYLIYRMRPAPDTPLGWIMTHIHALVINQIPIDTFLSSVVLGGMLLLLLCLLGVSLLRYCIGHMTLHDFVAGAVRFDPWSVPALATRLATMGDLPSRRMPPIYVIDSPAPLALTAGVLHPRIYLAHTLIELLTPDELLAVICHEWAHVLRYDNLWNSFVRLFRDTLPFFPGVSLAWKSMIASQDEACDELAVRMTREPLSLARALVKIAGAWQSHEAPALTVASPFALSVDDPQERVEQMIRIETEATSPRRWPAVGAYLLGGIVLLLGVLPALLGS
jgi:Zn-dependent protease with chaperone function